MKLLKHIFNKILEKKYLYINKKILSKIHKEYNNKYVYNDPVNILHFDLGSGLFYIINDDQDCKSIKKIGRVPWQINNNPRLPYEYIERIWLLGFKISKHYFENDQYEFNIPKRYWYSSGKLSIIGYKD